jgi:TPR repeat protein
MSKYFDMAAELYQKGDKVSAFNAFLELALDGAANAQTMVGYMLEKGEGCHADRQEAESWYEKAALQGEPGALYNLGILRKADAPESAFECFVKAARTGHLPAMVEAARMAREGDGVPRQLPRARNWFETAARMGYPDAMYEMGRMYETGEGVEASEEEAVKWYEEASRTGHEEARKALARLKA